MNPNKNDAEKPSKRGKPSPGKPAVGVPSSPATKKSARPNQNRAKQSREKSVAETPAGKDGDAKSEVPRTDDSGRSSDNTHRSRKAATLERESVPDRKEVVQLATQLVSAQIVAHSHHETAMNLFTEFQQFALDVVHFLKRNPPEPSDLDSVLGEVVELINEQWRSQLRSRKPRVIEPMTHPDLDRLFQSAMRRAFVMLNAPFDSERVVFAEQIFTHHESLTEGAIRQRFFDFKWPRLKSGDSVIKLMQDVNRWFTKHLKDLQAAHQSVDGKESISATDPNIPIATRIESEAARLSWLLEHTTDSSSLAPDTLSSYQALRSALSKFTNTRNGPDLGGAFRSLDASCRSNLIFLMFGGNGPRNVDATTANYGQDGVSGDANTKDSPRINYRPWAIFRYLRLHGRTTGDDLGKDLYDRLHARRSELNPAEVPDIPGIEPAEFRFGPLHQEAEDLVDELAAEGGSSDSGTNSNELELLGFDTKGIEGASSEFDSNDLQSDDGGLKF